MESPYREPAPRKPELGIVAVWTAGSCASQAFRIPHEGLVLGRDLLVTTQDDRISRQHARVQLRDRRLSVDDLRSSNGTFVSGQRIAARTAGLVPLSVIRTGRTVWIIVDDIDDPYVDKVVKKVVVAIQDVDATLAIHASAIEAAMMLFQRDVDEVPVIETARKAAKARMEAGGPLRGDDISPHAPHLNAVFPEQFASRRMIRRRSRE